MADTRTIWFEQGYKKAKEEEKKSYGKDYHVFKIIKSLSKKGRLKYTKIIIEDEEDYSINFIKERKTSSKREVLDLIEKCLNGKVSEQGEKQ
jgi:hypothetical protein